MRIHELFERQADGKNQKNTEIPNETTIKAMEEARQMSAQRKARFDTPEQLFAHLNNL